MTKEQIKELARLINLYEMDVLKCDERKCSDCEFFFWKCPDGYCAVNQLLHDVWRREDEED